MFLNINIKIFAGTGSVELARAVCEYLDIPLGGAKIDRFPDGEKVIKLEDDVRGRDCFVVQSTSNPVDENLIELLIYLDCLRRASATRITAVIPYFGYARQDRKSEGRVPITAKLVANLITTAGADRILAIDLHAQQLQGFFDIPMQGKMNHDIYWSIGIPEFFCTDHFACRSDCNRDSPSRIVPDCLLESTYKFCYFDATFALYPFV